MNTRRIYMDHQATTPLDARVLEAMLPYMTERFGNPASRHHSFGWEALEAVEEARMTCSRLIGCRREELFFTSGATEAINLAIKGLAHSVPPESGHLVTTSVEHNAVLDSVKRLEKSGYSVTVLPVDGVGRVTPEAVANAITEKTILVSVIHANNEIGTINDVAAIGDVCRRRGVAFHTDATQSIGKLPVHFKDMKIDMLSFSAHKFYGPKGIGGCVIRRELQEKVISQIDGGGHERGMRSGTLNVPGIAGMAKALELASSESDSEAKRLLDLRNRLWDGLSSRIPFAKLNGPTVGRLSGNLNVTFDFVEAEALLINLHDIALSSGSACTSARMEPSHVLKAIGLSEQQIFGSVRFGLGRSTTSEDIDYVIKRVTEEVERLRKVSPDYERAMRSQT